MPNEGERLKARAPSAVRIVTAALLLSIALELLNAHVFRLLILYPQMFLKGSIGASILVALVSIALFKFPERSCQTAYAPLSLILALSAFVGLDSFLMADWFPNISRKSIEPYLVVAYGVCFGSLNWALFTLFWVTADRIHHGGSKALFERKSGAESVVVFVHGLGGNADLTWGDFPSLLAGDPDLKGLDIFLWGYPTKVFGNVIGISQTSTQLQTELRVRLSDYKSLILVGHSLGGLLIRALVIDALRSNRLEDVDRIHHIVTFATPNDGSEYAKIARLVGLANKQVKDIDSAGDTVVQLRNEWVNRVYLPNIRPGEERSKKKIPLTSVAGLNDDVVTFASAKAFFADPPPETVPGTHTTMKLPESRESICYLVLRKILLQKRTIPMTAA